MKHCPKDLVRIFNTCFNGPFETELLFGESDPVYIPKKADELFHKLYFAHGFFSSALHEISHWCIAGPERRLLEDFGYWYNPDGRSKEQQIDFLKVEVRPQAIEWIFHDAAEKEFHFSFDNLNCEEQIEDLEDVFASLVIEEKERLLKEGLPPRAETFRKALTDFYH